MSVTERETSHLGRPYPSDSTALKAFSQALCAAGLEIRICRQATAADVEELGSTWAKRLGVPSRRPAWLLGARRYA